MTPENKMGTAPVPRLLLTMALPVMLSTAIQALYNVVDGIFVSRLGEDALAAITFCGPMNTVLAAVGSGIAVGMSTLLSHSLGEKNQKGADEAACGALWLTLAAGVLGVLAVFTVIKPYLAFMTGSAAIRQAGWEYASVTLGLGVGTVAQLVLERMLIATGRTSLSMVSQGVGGLLNIILDPILIFGLGSFPALGVRGAAVATVCSQLCAAGIALLLNLRRNTEIHLTLRVRPSAHTMKRLIQVGGPTALILSLNSIMMVNYNAVLNQFSTTAVAVFGVCCRITSFFAAIVTALCNTAAPIIAYNHGARQKPRIDSAIRWGYLYSIALMALATLLCCGFPAFFLRLFNATEEMMEIGIWGERMLTCCFVFWAVRVMSNSVLQALGRSVPAMLCDLSRNYLVLIPAAWLLSLTGSLGAVWLSVPLADFVSSVVGFLLMRRAYRRDIAIPLGGNYGKVGEACVLQ